MPKVQNKALLKMSRYDPLMISVSSTKPSNVPVVFIFFFPLNDHTCVRPVTYWMWKSNHARTRTSPFMQTSGLRDYRTRHGKPVRIQPFVYCGLQREGRCMNIWGEDGNGFTVEIHSYVTMLSAHVYLSLNPPLFSAACTVPTTKLSFEWLLAFIPNLTPKANTGGEGTRTSQKHGIRSASVSQVLVHSCAALTLNLAKLS